MSVKTTVTLDLTTQEAKFLASAMINTILFDSDEGHIAEAIYEALVDEAGVDDYVNGYTFVTDTKYGSGLFLASKIVKEAA